METHVSIVGVLYIVFGALGLLIALGVFVILAGGGILSGDETAMAVTTGIGFIVAIIIALLAIPEIIGGVFLLKRKEWARIFVLILSFLNLLSIPFGTILGGYAIWVLMKDETIRLFQPSATITPTT